MAGDRAVGVAGHVEHAESGTCRLNGLRKLPSVGVGHDDVGQQEIDLSLVTPRDVQRGAAAVGLQHRIALGGKRAMRQAAQLLVILHDEHGPSPGARRFDRRDLPDVLGQRRDGGEIDLERRALAGLGIEPDVATRLLDDAVHGRQPKAGSAPRGLGGEEWLEDPRLRPLVHPAAGIGDGKHDVFARDDRDVLRGVRIVECGVSGFDRHGAAVGHRVARVDREIHDDLLDLVWIGACGREVVRQVRLELDVLGDQRAQHLVEV